MHHHSFKQNFPEMYRTFNDGELAICLERFGGINDISLLDVEYRDGVPYPDQNCTPIFSRLAACGTGKSLYGPAIRFLSRNSNSDVNYFYPESPEVTPWSVRNTHDNSFELFIDDHVIDSAIK